MATATVAPPTPIEIAVHDIPVKLRCGICKNLATQAFRLPCCEQSICGSCQAQLPAVCPVCEHSPLDKSDCRVHASLRTTVAVFLRTAEKKHALAQKASSEVTSQKEDRKLSIPESPITPVHTIVPFQEPPSTAEPSEQTPAGDNEGEDNGEAANAASAGNGENREEATSDNQAAAGSESIAAPAKVWNLNSNQFPGHGWNGFGAVPPVPSGGWGAYGHMMGYPTPEMMSMAMQTGNFNVGGYGMGAGYGGRDGYGWANGMGNWNHGYVGIGANIGNTNGIANAHFPVGGYNHQSHQPYQAQHRSFVGQGNAPQLGQPGAAEAADVAQGSENVKTLTGSTDDDQQDEEKASNGDAGSPKATSDLSNEKPADLTGSAELSPADVNPTLNGQMPHGALMNNNISAVSSVNEVMAMPAGPPFGVPGAGFYPTGFGGMAPMPPHWNGNQHPAALQMNVPFKPAQPGPGVEGAPTAPRALREGRWPGNRFLRNPSFSGKPASLDIVTGSNAERGRTRSVSPSAPQRRRSPSYGSDASGSRARFKRMEEDVEEERESDKGGHSHRHSHRSSKRKLRERNKDDDSDSRDRRHSKSHRDRDVSRSRSRSRSRREHRHPTFQRKRSRSGHRSRSRNRSRREHRHSSSQRERSRSGHRSRRHSHRSHREKGHDRASSRRRDRKRHSRSLSPILDSNELKEDSHIVEKPDVSDQDVSPVERNNNALQEGRRGSTKRRRHSIDDLSESDADLLEAPITTNDGADDLARHDKRKTEQHSDDRERSRSRDRKGEDRRSSRRERDRKERDHDKSRTHREKGKDKKHRSGDHERRERDRSRDRGRRDRDSRKEKDDGGRVRKRRREEDDTRSVTEASIGLSSKAELSKENDGLNHNEDITKDQASGAKPRARRSVIKYEEDMRDGLEDRTEREREAVRWAIAQRS